MLRLASYDIVFQEIPDEVTLALNLSCCPNRCPGCHSPHLREPVGEILDEDLLSGLIGQYGTSVTCICFMGGDNDPVQVERLSRYVRTQSAERIKTGWYSGRDALPVGLSARHFDFLKLGPYVERLGGLDSPTTNQRFYRIEDGQPVECTHLFRKHRTNLV